MVSRSVCLINTFYLIDIITFVLPKPIVNILPYMRYLTAFLLLLCSLSLYSSDKYPRDSKIDVQNYRFDIYLSDSYNMISGEAYIRIAHTGKSNTIGLDLIGIGEDGKGMKVESVTVDEKKVDYTHSEGRLNIALDNEVSEGSTSMVYIKYYGTPANGLIIAQNRYGDRTFFADNWPDRARHWIPCVDHPSDKAKVEFKIFAPSHYKVVANGKLVEESDLPEGIKLTHWREDISIPTKVMVFGAAKFASQLVETVGGIDIWSYVFPEDRDNGFGDYAIAVEPFIFFCDEIGSYPYEKLANVQSKTMFGGMENAGCIFYSERSVTGNKKIEGLMAHEIAHQWFGNSVTENDWHHVWLSEGFATYFTSRYMEFKYGKTRMRTDMTHSRNRVIRAIERNPAPVIDTTIINLMNLLSTYSYQKGAWVLHMMRNELGDTDFKTCIRTYYNRYRNQTALTSDLKNTVIDVAGIDLSGFFQQWLYREDIPVLSMNWEYSQRRKEIQLTITQTQEGEPFVFPLDVEITQIKGDKLLENFNINKRVNSFTIKCESKPDMIIPDPKVKLLFSEQ